MVKEYVFFYIVCDKVEIKFGFFKFYGEFFGWGDFLILFFLEESV